MRTLLYMSIALVMSFLVTACSEENQQEPITIESQSLFASKRAVKAPTTTFDAYLSVKAAIETHGMPALPLDRGSFYELQSLSGIETEIDTKSANLILDELFVFQEMGVVPYIRERTNFTELTKDLIIKIIAEESIEGIDEVEGFASLKRDEQELLLHLNAISLEFKEGAAGFEHRDRYCGTYISGYDSYAPCTRAGAVIGGTIGMSLCSFPCGIIGGVLGGLFGHWLDTK
ncbi:hypothetical protein [Gilvibacter sediminis]|uniref:hypothetical protein n=1 Tax=Gilvibacter sediminis TaxID=379071 RepID=UPI00234FCD76|nr:hypothetical protein [Gilvibacter sediminis]MDC7996678.1 hypothetical protein [Gilvibacter sediminis]